MTIDDLKQEYQKVKNNRFNRKYSTKTTHSIDLIIIQRILLMNVSLNGQIAKNEIDTGDRE